MHSEFDTVAAWTAEVARDLGPDYYLPAACRGSGSPAALEWFIEHLGIDTDTTLLDSGAGVGGPAAFAAKRTGVRPVLVEPEPGACRAIAELFGLPVARGDAAALPVASASADAAWSLGVLCTMDDQVGMLRELRRVTRAPGRIGLLVYVARHRELPDQPAGNNFPTTDGLLRLIAGAGLRVEAWASTPALPGPPADWQERADRVEQELRRRYAGNPDFDVADRQSSLIAELLGNGDLGAELLLARHA